MKNLVKNEIKEQMQSFSKEDPFQEYLMKMEMTNETYSEKDIDSVISDLIVEGVVEKVSKTRLAFGKIFWVIYPKIENLKYFYLDNGSHGICKEVVVATSKDPSKIKLLIQVIKNKMFSEYGVPISELEFLPVNDPSDFEIDFQSFLSYNYKIKL